MVNIGTEPILWHIMKIYAAHNITNFIVACGYKGHMIKEYFSNIYLSASDVTFDLKNNAVEVHHSRIQPWKVTCVDTGMDTMTGGRLRRLRDYIGEDTFCMTYGDGVANIDLTAEIAFHKQHGRLATLTAISPPGRFGAFSLEEDELLVRHYQEKPQSDTAWINGGFFVLEPKVIDHIDSDFEPWEQSPLRRLAKQSQLAAFRHSDFWQSMDTLRDKRLLEELWASGNAPWKIWNE